MVLIPQSTFVHIEEIAGLRRIYTNIQTVNKSTNFEYHVFKLYDEIQFFFQKSEFCMGRKDRLWEEQV